MRKKGVHGDIRELWNRDRRRVFGNRGTCVRGFIDFAGNRANVGTRGWILLWTAWFCFRDSAGFEQFSFCRYRVRKV